MSFSDVVDLLDRTEVIAIVTTRADGTAVATPIWSMVIDGVPYLRSAYGGTSWWYRHVLAGRPAAIALGDGRIAETDRAAALRLPPEPVRLVAVPAADPVQGVLDAEVRRKYAAAEASSVEVMQSDEALAHTLRVEPPALG